MTDPNLIEAVEKVAYEIDQSLWWVAFWLFLILLTLGSTYDVRIKKDD